jgi:hypothetical protein
MKAQLGDIDTEYSFGSYPLESIVSVFQATDGDFYLHYSFVVTPANITVGQYTDKYTTAFEIVGQILDEKGRMARSIYDTVEIALTEEQFNQVKSFPFGYEDRIAILPGNYKMHLVVKNDPKKEVGLMDASFQVPEGGNRNIRIEGLTLGYLISEKEQVPTAVQPFQISQKKLFPAIGRRFGRSDTLRVFYELVLPEGAAAADLSLDFRIMNGAQEVLRDTGTAADCIDLGSGFVFVSKPIRIPAMPAGSYRIEVRAALPSPAVSASASQEFTVENSKVIPRPWIKTKTYQGEAFDQLQLGLQFMGRENYPDAEARVKKAVELDPSLTVAKIKLAGIYLKENKLKDVVKVCAPLVFQDPNNTDAALHLALAYSGLKNYAEAVKLYDQVIQGGMETDSILNAMAEACYNAGDIRKAVEILKRSLALYPEQPRIREFLEKLSAGKPG